MDTTSRPRKSFTFRRPTLHSLSRSRFLFLLIALLVLLLGSPFLDDSLTHRSYLAVLFALVMLSAVRIASDSRIHTIVTLTICAVWAILSVGSLVGEQSVLTIGAHVLFVALSVYTLWIVLRAVVSADQVDFDTLLGAASLYLLIGLIWTFSYLIIHLGNPEAFHLIHGETRPYFHQFLYFSFVTLATLGYGDITPLSPFAQIWSVMEAIVGTFYIALLVARLVSMYQSQHPRRG